jgi:hypothetical protein
VVSVVDAEDSGDTTNGKLTWIDSTGRFDEPTDGYACRSNVAAMHASVGLGVSSGYWVTSAPCPCPAPSMRRRTT